MSAVQQTGRPEISSQETILTVPDGDVQVPVALERSTRSVVDSRERNVLRTLQDQFVSNVRETSLDPTDSAYQSAWEQAQTYSDERFRALFGNEAFLKARMQARAQSANDSR